MARYFEVITECPFHKKLVHLRLEATTSTEAVEKALGMVVDCPWGPINTAHHRFVVGFRGGRKEILGVRDFPRKPEPDEIIAWGPSFATAEVRPPHLTLETVYYMDPERAEEQLAKSEWWKVRVW